MRLTPPSIAPDAPSDGEKVVFELLLAPTVVVYDDSQSGRLVEKRWPLLHPRR